MSGYIDLNYISKIQPRLQQFKKKRDYLFNFRCPVCGDSKKSKTKARAYLYRVKNDMFFKCHNCSASHNLANLIKLVDRPLYDQYILERYKGSKPSNEAESLFDKFKTNTKDKLKNSTPLQGLTAFSTLDDEHPAKQYLLNRKLPTDYFDRLYYCDKFHNFVNKLRPGTFSSLNMKYEHPRLIIPFYDINEKIFGFQGRAFGKEQPKYLTIKLDEGKQKVYGLERINFQQEVFITEGPIDSLFIDNCLAAGGADLFLKNKIPNDQITYIFDNEPRNNEIVNRMYKVIEQDYNIVIWPDDIQLKDVNDIIKSGVSVNKLKEIISSNTYSKLSAMTKLNYWKKV